MMTSVWEGILYGIINRDYYGALVPPYSSLIVPFLVLLFYSLVKAVWDKDVAFFVALFFPFYDNFSYYGLGILICVAAIAYIRKNTYVRAAILWGSFCLVRNISVRSRLCIRNRVNPFIDYLCVCIQELEGCQTT